MRIVSPVGRQPVETYNDARAAVEEVIPEHASEFVENLLPSIRFRRAGKEPTRPALQLGGDAHFPEGIPWPMHGDRPMHLIAILDLAQVAPFDSSGQLPASGLVHFFYDVISFAWGFDPEHGSAWRVQCFSDRECADAPARSRPPHGDDSGFVVETSLGEQQHRDGFVQWTAPSPEEPCIDYWSWPDRDEMVRKLWRLDDFEGLGANGAEQVLGWASSIQGPMQLECQLASNGINVGRSSGFDDPRRAGLQPGASRWRLLLQVPSWDEGSGAAWGDGAGMLYFWIREHDLRDGAFDQTWMILQSG